MLPIAPSRPSHRRPSVAAGGCTAGRQDGRDLRDRSPRSAGWSRVIVEFTASRTFASSASATPDAPRAARRSAKSTTPLASHAGRRSRGSSTWSRSAGVPDARTHGRRHRRRARPRQIRSHRPGRRRGGDRLGHHVVSRRPLHQPQQPRHATRRSLQGLPPSTSNSDRSATDDYGHGTHVAGIIAGSGADSDGARTGIAPGAKLIGLKVLDGNGNGTHQRRHRRDRLRHRHRERPTTSASSTCRSPPPSTSPTSTIRSRSPRAARSEAGIVVVASAGNLGRNERRRSAVRRHHGAGQRALGPDRRRQQPQGHGDAQRRRHRRVQLARPDVDRLHRQAGPHRSGRRHRIALSGRHSTLCNDADYLLDGTVHTPFKPYLSLSGTSMAAPVVGRHGGADARGQPVADAERGESDPAVPRRRWTTRRSRKARAC